MPEKKKRVVPRLRFPEFRDAEDWEVKQIQEVCGFIVPGRNKPRVFDGNIPWITTPDLDDGRVVNESRLSYKVSISEAKSIGSKVVPAGSVLMSCAGELGIVALAGCDIIINQQLHAFLPTTVINGLFLAYAIKTQSSYIDSVATKMAVPYLNKDNCNSIPIPLPPLPEQQKIADCLSSLDEVIDLEAQKLEALKAHKKGLMQQLFPREGETTPSLRFPEFRDAGEWEVKRLGDVVKVTGGGTPSTKIKEFWDGSIPWVSSSDIAEDSVHGINVRKFITEEAIKNSATRIVPENSILLVSRVGVGKLAVSRRPMCTSQDFTNLTPVKDDALFLAYCLKAIMHIFESFNQGMAIKGFTKEDVENLQIALPNFASGEQQKIADCLALLDEVINLQTQKLDALKAHKKGLMQQLFPQEVD